MELHRVVGSKDGRSCGEQGMYTAFPERGGSHEGSLWIFSYVFYQMYYFRYSLYLFLTFYPFVNSECSW